MIIYFKKSWLCFSILLSFYLYTKAYESFREETFNTFAANLNPQTVVHNWWVSLPGSSFTFPNVRLCQLKNIKLQKHWILLGLRLSKLGTCPLKAWVFCMHRWQKWLNQFHIIYIFFFTFLFKFSGLTFFCSFFSTFLFNNCRCWVWKTSSKGYVAASLDRPNFECICQPFIVIQ